MPPEISVVIPVYACAPCLRPLTARLVKTLAKLAASYEIIFVDDGSKDRAWAVIGELAGKNNKVKGLKLSRNFGQHRAITAGLDYARGNWVVVMDGDLQDQPEEIPKLYLKAREEGYEIVFARRNQRQDSWGKRTWSWWYHQIFSLLSGLPADPQIANFSICARQVVEAFGEYPERFRSFREIVRAMGFRQTSVSVVHARRPEGKSGYTPLKMLSLALDTATGYSTRLLTVWIWVGFFLAAVSMIIGLSILVRYFTYGIGVAGWASVMVMISGLSGMILLGIGILGIYLAKLFGEMKQRPLYHIAKRLGV